MLRTPALNRSLLLHATAISMLALALGTPALGQPMPATTATPPTAASADHDALFKIFRDSDEASLRRNPLSAIFRGDLRYADHLGDSLSDAYFNAERAAAEADLAALMRIDRTRLNPTDQLAYDVFAYTQRDVLKDYTPEILALTVVRRSTISRVSTLSTPDPPAARARHRSRRSPIMKTT